MNTDLNPYQAPSAAGEPASATKVRPEGNRLKSVFLIAAGALFCISSFYAMLGHGVESFLANYRNLGRFSVAFLLFYGFTGALTAAFHLAWLMRGWPSQSLAGLIAIGIALGLAGGAMVLLEFITWSL